MKPWYTLPKELDKPVWSEPYFDERGGNVIMTTYLSPIYVIKKNGRRGKFSGVTAADIPSVGFPEPYPRIRVARVSAFLSQKKADSWCIPIGKSFCAGPSGNRHRRVVTRY